MDTSLHDSLLIFRFPGDDDRPRELAFAAPEEVIVAHSPGEVVPALRRVEAATSRGCWAAGCIAYEAAPAFDAALAVRPDASGFPLLWFGIYAAPITAPAGGMGAFSVSDWTPDISQAVHRQRVGAVREAIARGETYQVNLTHRLQARFSGNARAYWDRLCRGQEHGYAAYLDLGRWKVLSASPELFFRRAGSRVITRPMKGTAPRGRWSEEDEERAAALASSAKERAENVMIVDLLRNDLGRVAAAGSVTVSRLFDVERYRTVLQMTSTVEATLASGASLVDLFAALFPCGSVTGAPKVQTMRHIAAFESAPRRVYCGAIGYIAPGGDACFSVPIRTAIVDTATGDAEYGVGGGVTWDSDPDAEWRETVNKAAILTRCEAEFDLLETLRLENGVYFLRERHIARLAASAAYFGVSVSADAVSDALDRLAAERSAGAWRVRLLVAPDGLPRTECAPLHPLPSPITVELATWPVSRDDIFLFHKTTHRAVYEAHRAAHPDAFDVLLWNERGELCEFTTGNLLLAQDGVLWTPPRASGLLAGTLRAELLERGEIRERTLTLDDLTTADRIWYLNSVRGRVAVAPLPPPPASRVPGSPPKGRGGMARVVAPRRNGYSTN